MNIAVLSVCHLLFEISQLCSIGDPCMYCFFTKFEAFHRGREAVQRLGIKSSEHAHVFVVLKSRSSFFVRTT